VKYKDRDKLVADLREFADFIERRGLDLPLDGVSEYNRMVLIQRFYVESEAKDKMIRAAKNVGSAEKKYRLGDLELRKYMTNRLVELRFETAQENVCTKRVVGTGRFKKHRL
jgi:hypothetical protein